MPPSSTINPFVVGGAINAADGKGFYGREDIFAFVSEALHSVQRAPILLIGQRRIGKSSVLKQLQVRLGAFYRCIFYDLQGRAELTLDETLYGLGRAIADGLEIPRPEPEEATADTFPDFLHRAIQALDGHPERLVLLFDEFDVVDQAFAGKDIAAKRFIPYLAETIAAFPAFGYILVVGRRSEELSDGFFSSILRQTVQMRIGRLDRNQTQRLVTESFGTNLRLSQAAVDEIFVLTAGHPFCAQILCSTIWNRFIATASDIEIGVRHVHEAVQIAVQQWTNGLNWNYDGFEEATQRLFLSALAVLCGPNALGAVSFANIKNALTERRVGVDETKLNLAPHDLKNWDVIEGGPHGYRFTVPLIGVWIQKVRPLQDFEQETRLINPRAAKYYDLALDSQQRGNLDDAIRDFRNALEANPVFLEAQLGLAASLRERKEPGDFNAALEAYERVLELDPSSARGTLLDLLLEDIEASQADSRLAIRRYKRISELEAAGRYRDRAGRILQQMAHIRFQFGTGMRLQEAIDLWTLTGNEDDVAEARKLLVRVNRATVVCGATWFTLAVLWFIAIKLPKTLPLVKEYTPWLPIALASFAAQAMSCQAATEYDGRFTFRRVGLIGGALGITVGMLTARFFTNPIYQGILIFFVVFFANFFINQDSLRTLPAELSSTRSNTDVPLRESVARWLITTGAWLARKKKAGPEPDNKSQR